MGVAIKIIDFQISPYLGQVTINEGGGGTTDIPLTGLSISGSNTIPTNTSSIQLSIVYTPSNTTQKGVNWTSSNSSIASVNSVGLVTVVSRPSTDTSVIITATSSKNASIKATHSIVVSSSVSPSTSYITNGLVQYYDAIDNQGRGTERISGTVEVGHTWVDLVSGVKMSIQSIASKTNFGQFDAKSYSLLAYSSAAALVGFMSNSDWPFSSVGTGDFTVECTMTTPSTLIDGHDGFYSDYNTNEPNRFRFQVGITPTGAIKFNYRTQSDAWREKYFTTDSVVKTSTFYNLAIVRKNGVVTAYLNGESIGTADFSGEIFSSTAAWYLADNGQPAAYHAYRFYNRALTQVELTTNVNYDISRYK